jgi:hypothetical protein
MLVRCIVAMVDIGHSQDAVITATSSKSWRRRGCRDYIQKQHT